MPQGRGIIMLPKEYLLRNSELCTGYLRTGDNADTGGDDSNTFREGYMSAGDSLRDTGYLRTDVETLRRSPLRREHTDTGGADSNTFKRNKSAGNNYHYTTARTIPAEGDNFCRNIDEASAKGFSPS